MHRSQAAARRFRLALAACCALGAHVLPYQASAADGCRITLVAVGAAALPAGARETLRLVTEHSEARDASGEWRALAGRCAAPGRDAPRDALARCSLASACGPHQLLLRFEWLAGLTGVATAARSAVVPESGWTTLADGMVVPVDVAQLLVADVRGPRTRRVPR